VIVYIDDILVMTESYDEHLKVLEKVLKTLERYKAKIKLEKCEFCTNEIKFLGHVIGKDGIKKDESYIVQKLVRV